VFHLWPLLVSLEINRANLPVHNLPVGFFFREFKKGNHERLETHES
jgi:hypothetical protein